MAAVSTLRAFAVFVLCFLVAPIAACAPTPAQPSAPLDGATSQSLKPSPSPTPKPGACTCKTVTVQFDPGGATPQWGVFAVKHNSQWRVGFRIDVTCTGMGDSRNCTVVHAEKGTLTATLGKQTGKIVGKTSTVTKFPVVNPGDPWQKEYSDALGFDYPLNTTGTMSLVLDMEFEISCRSNDGTPPVAKKFRIQGSVDAQAATKGGKPSLNNPVLTLTPIG